MEIDSYVKHKLMKIKYQKALTQKPNDLFSAYEFAQKNKLSKSNFLKAHKLISKHILVASEQGKTRNSEMIVLDDRQRVLYEACPKDTVNEIFTTFFKNITTLLKKKNSIDEIFFYASLLHLVCVNIHPFADGNGRSARLLEKWFLAEKLGEKAWFIQSELYYWNHREMYCKNLSKQGVFYEKINYDTSLDFLLMLPKSLKNINK
ncbi:MAG: Fic family protein [Capnocytophaga sp.]|nr:Fic family protein [Capnocytophaga sp.]